MTTFNNNQIFQDPFTSDAAVGGPKVAVVGDVCINCEG